MNYESDPKTKKELKVEADESREERCRLNQLSREIARNAEAANQVRIQELALNGGSRFNLRYDHRIDRGPTPTVDQLKDALAQYVIFDLQKTTAAVAQTSPQASAVDDTDAKDLTEASSTTLQTGQNWAQVFQLLGPPTEASSRELEGIKLMECVFEQENKAIKALFANDVLIRYRIFSRYSN